MADEPDASTTSVPAAAAPPAAPQPAAPTPTTATAPSSTPSTAGFKLKLKLGGSSSAQNAGSLSVAQSASPPIASTSTTPASTSAHAPAQAALPSTEDADMLADAPDDPTAAGHIAELSTSNDVASTSAAGASSAGPSGGAVGEEGQQASSTPTAASPSTTTSAQPKQYESSIGNIVLPVLTGGPAAPTAGKRKKQPTGEAGTGLGRGWRKGLKGYTRQDGAASPNASGSMTPPAGTTTSAKRRRAHAALPAAATEDASMLGEEDASMMDSEDYVPNMVATSGLVTSDKWANGLPGGNEQSRLTASMANAVNKQFPVGQPPKTGSGFLQPQPLDKSTPKPRSWKKIKREIVPPSGIAFTVTVWQGDNESEYIDYMIEHPRPIPIDKKAQSTAIAGLGIGEAGSPAPEGSYPPSEGGTPADPASDAPAAGTSTGAPAGRGSGRGRGRGGATKANGQPRRKPGPPKKAKGGAATAAPAAAVTPAVAAATPASAVTPAPAEAVGDTPATQVAAPEAATMSTDVKVEQSAPTGPAIGEASVNEASTAVKSEPAADQVPASASDAALPLEPATAPATETS